MSNRNIERREYALNVNINGNERTLEVGQQVIAFGKPRVITSITIITDKSGNEWPALATRIVGTGEVFVILPDDIE